MLGNINEMLKSASHPQSLSPISTKPSPNKETDNSKNWSKIKILKNGVWCMYRVSGFGM